MISCRMMLIIIITSDDNVIIISSSQQHLKIKIGVRDFGGTFSNKKNIVAKNE